MKFKLFIVTFLLPVFTLSCKDKIVNAENVSISEQLKNNSGQWKYDCVKINFSDLVVMDYGSKTTPFLIEYAFSGVVKNNTENIYKKATLRCILLFNLKNGRVLASNDEMKYGTLEYDIPCSLDNWKPGEEREVKRLSTHKIGSEYIDYPFTQVMKQVSLKLTDEINGRYENIIVSQMDVTEKWNIAVNKIKEKKPDCWFTDIASFISPQK